MRILIVCILILLFSVSCFEKDEIIPPVEYNGKVMVFNESIYENQFFYDLETNSIVMQNPNNAWDLSFDCGIDQYIVRINSSNMLGACETNSTDFNSTSYSLSGVRWFYDKSDGNSDSTAIKNWIDTQVFPYSYSNKVFLIGKTNDGGYNYTPLKKIQFYIVTDTSYRFRYANIDGSGLQDIVIYKDTTFNRKFFSFNSNSEVIIEPPKNNWDIEFTQYFSTLYTDNGLPVPYPLRGVLINSFQVGAALDTIAGYENIDLLYVANLNLSTNWDVIGYDWKGVLVDEGSNSAIYSVREQNNYIIRDTNGQYFKLKFISFHNTRFEPGYPTFIIDKLK